MNISGFWQRINPLENRDIYIVLVIILVALASFGLGRLSAHITPKEPVRIENPASVSQALSESKSETPLSSEEKSLPEGGQVVGSKNGNKYHFPWCSGAQRIKEENKVYFASAEEAEKAGYTKASNCKGL